MSAILKCYIFFWNMLFYLEHLVLHTETTLLKTSLEDQTVQHFSPNLLSIYQWPRTILLTDSLFASRIVTDGRNLRLPGHKWKFLYRTMLMLQRKSTYPMEGSGTLEGEHPLYQQVSWKSVSSKWLFMSNPSFGHYNCVCRNTKWIKISWLYLQIKIQQKISHEYIALSLFFFKGGGASTAFFKDGQFSPGPQLVVARISPGGVQINKDEVLVFNGYDGGLLSKADIYNVQTGSWTDVGPSPGSSYQDSAVLIQGSDGEDIVFITGIKFVMMLLSINSSS